MPLKAHAALTKRLNFAYKSTWAIIVILLILAQAIIQLTLHTEVTTRNMATLLSRQELHSQRMLRNSILLFSDPKDAASVSPPGIDPASQMQQDLTFIETTNTQLLSSGTPLLIVQAVQALQPDYTAMDHAGRTLLDTRKSPDRKAKVAPLEAMFLHEQKYLAGVFAIYTAVTQQADTQVQAVQVIEIVLFLISITTLLVEAFVVIAPAMRDYAKIADTLRQARDKYKTVPLQAQQEEV